MAKVNLEHSGAVIDQQINRVISGSVVVENTLSALNLESKKPVDSQGIASAIKAASDNIEGDIDNSLNKVYKGGKGVVNELSTTISSSSKIRLIDIPESVRGKVLSLSIITDGEYQVYLVNDTGSETLLQNWKTGNSTLTISTTSSLQKVKLYTSSLNVGSSLNVKIEIELPSLNKVYEGGKSVVSVLSTTIPSSAGDKYLDIPESVRGKVLSLSIITDGEYQVYLVKDAGAEIVLQNWKTGNSSLVINTTPSSRRVRLYISSLNAGSSFYAKLEVELPSLKDIEPLVLKHNEYLLSPANKHADFGITTFMPYHCQQTDLSFGGANTTTAEIYAQFDKLVESGFFTKESIGYASDSTEMFCYKRDTAVPSVETNPLTPYMGDKTALDIFIVAGLHGFEKCNIFGLLYLMNDIANNSDKCPMLQYLNEMCNFIIVPCANPYGIDNSVYENNNDVNLNRNFPVRNWVADDSKNTGASASDQPEVANIVSLLSKHPNASLVIDSHTNGMAAVSSNKNVNWMDINYSDVYRGQMLDVARFHLRNISSIFRSKYKGESTDISPIYGYIRCAYIENTTSGTLDSYAAQQGHISLTFEGFNGFTGGTVASNAVKSANAELIGNFIIAFCAKYGNLQ